MTLGREPSWPRQPNPCTQPQTVLDHQSNPAFVKTLSAHTKRGPAAPRMSSQGKGRGSVFACNVPGLVTISRSSEPAVADRRGWVTPDALTAGGGDASHVLHVLDERSCIYMNMHGADRRFCSPNARCAAMPNIMTPRALDFASRGTQTGCIFRAWGCDI